MLKNGDFIRLEYEGFDEQGNAFDSTKGEIGKSLHGKDGPLLVVVGHYRLIKGLDETVRQMKKGDEKEVTFGPEKAFGKRTKDMIKVMSIMDFKEHNVFPQPGVTIHVDTDQGRIYGTVKSVSGGRVMVDFNHPLANKKVRYKIKLVDIIDGSKPKLEALVSELGLKGEVSENSGEAKITLEKKKDDKEFELKRATFHAMAKGFIPDLKKIDLVDKESA